LEFGSRIGFLSPPLKSDFSAFDETLDALLTDFVFGIESEGWLFRLFSAFTPHPMGVFECVGSDLSFSANPGIAVPPERLWQSVSNCGGGRFLVRLHSHPSSLTSLIIADFPRLFSKFGRKRFPLLWRGSCHGFRCWDFHNRCDGHKNTLTLIETSRHNIVGDYTPCVWRSSGGSVYDETGRTFVFTLKNPHNLSARKISFVKGKMAIYCSSWDGVSFGSGFDIRVLDNCHADAKNYLNFGCSFVNDTGIERKILFDGEYHFTVHEIEIFAISE
jgi:hypothetical protein